MLENNEEQLQELEEKLESLTQRLEDLELNPSSFDPFDQYDVERMLEDFRNKEQGLGSQVEEAAQQVTESEDTGFIQISSSNAKKAPFEVHWVDISECGDTYTGCESIDSNNTAAKALLEAVKYRSSPDNNKRRVKHGDVLILLCRNSGELPEDASESEEPLDKSCTYMGMYATYGTRQESEPDATAVVETRISETDEKGDMFVWSSCSDSDCENLGNDVDILTVSSSGSESGSQSSFTFLKAGNGSSPYDSGVLDYVTDLSVEKANVGTTTKGLIIASDVSDVTAGYHGSLKKLTSSLSNWWVDYKKKKFKIESDVGSIATGVFNFGSSGGALINKPLLSDECGNLRISIYTDSSTIDLFTGSLSSTSGNFSNFAKNISVSLGTLEDIDTSEGGGLGIATELTTVSKFEEEAVDAKEIFFPAISANDAGSILTTDSISYLENYELTIEARYTVVYENEGKGDAEYYFYKKEKKVNNAKFASGLFYDGANEDPDGTEKVLLGVIRVKDIPLRYGCHETYGCQLDPAGQYYDSACGSGCEVPYEPMLTYRPPYVYVYYYNFANKCYTLKSEHVRDDTDERNDISNHYYSNGGRYTAKIIDGKTETIFYVNDAKETDVVRSSPVAEAEICKTFDSELEDFSDQYSGVAEIHTRERDFIPITVGASIKIQFFPRYVEDQITVWYRKNGDYIALIDEVTLTVEQEDGADASGGVFIGAGGPLDSIGFEWIKEVPVGADAIKLEVDGTVSGDSDTLWRYQIQKA